LRPDVDRGVLVVELAVDPDGRVARSNFYPAMIRSRARLVYEQAAPAVEGGGAGGLPSEIALQLQGIGQVTAGLRRLRAAGGSIDFDLPEPELVLGSDGTVIDVIAAPRTAAHRAVEDAMLAANRAVAELLARRAEPAVFRNHDPPQPKNVEVLLDVFETFGLDPDGLGGRGSDRDDTPVPPPSWIAGALAQVAGRPEERLVHQLVLRCMSRADYGADQHGHYALAFRHYAHFTSPIRRYADLVVHRALIAVLAAGDRPTPAPNAALRRQRVWMQRVAGRTSRRERVAVEAEREATDLQRCAFLAHHVGEVHPATVTGVSPFGLWLTLDPWFVEGLVHVSSLPEYVEFDEKLRTFTARRSGERFRLGDRFDVRVEDVDQLQARIDFRLVARRDDGAQRASKRRSRSPRSL
jgi:ribonuclease R